MGVVGAVGIAGWSIGLAWLMRQIFDLRLLTFFPGIGKVSYSRRRHRRYHRCILWDLSKAQPSSDRFS